MNIIDQIKENIAPITGIVAVASATTAIMGGISGIAYGINKSEELRVQSELWFTLAFIGMVFCLASTAWLIAHGDRRKCEVDA